MTDYTTNTSNVTGYEYSGDGLEAAVSYPVLGWAPSKHVDGSQNLNGISCPSATFCAAVDGTGNVVTYNGTAWSAASDIDLARQLNAVSCTSATFCAAVDNTGHVVTYNGTVWTASDIDGTNPIKAVSCTSATFCVAVDNMGNALILTVAGWSAASDIDSTRHIKAVSCASTVFCAAVDNMGYAITYNGTSWSSPPQLVDSGRILNAVSCPTASFCAAVDSTGHVLTSNGTTWSTTVTDIDGANDLGAISCASSSICEAVDGSGNVLVYNGSWGSAQDIDGTTQLDAVSCPTTLFCAASDNAGLAFTFNGSTQVSSQLVWDTAGSLALVVSDGTNYYIYGGGAEPVEQVNVTSSPPASNPAFLTYEPSDSTWLVTNTAGQQVAFYGYDAFGNLAFGTPDSPFGYAGQYTDTSANPSGFDNMRARFYDPQTGAFASRDPAFAQTDKAYVYAGGDPVNTSDPSGNWCIGVLEPILCGGGDHPSCHDWIGVNKFCGIPPNAQTSGHSCYQDVFLSINGGQSGDCPTGYLSLSNELLNYIWTLLPAQPTPVNIEFEIDIAAQSEGCWGQDPSSPLETCAEKWFSWIGDTDVSEDELLQSFQITGQDDILLIGYYLHSGWTDAEYDVEFVDWFGRLADLVDQPNEAVDVLCQGSASGVLQ